MKRNEQYGQSDAQIVLDELSEALSHDPQAIKWWSCCG